MRKDFEQIICDRLEGWELVEFLQISIEDVVVAFKETIEENYEDVAEFCGLRSGLDEDGD